MGFQYWSHWLQWIIHVTENCHTASFLLLHASIISKSWFNRELGTLIHWVSPSLSYSYVADSIGSFLSSLMLSPFITILTSENMEAQSRTNRIWFRWTLHVKQTKICILVYCIFWQLYTYSTNWSNGILKVKTFFGCWSKTSTFWKQNVTCSCSTVSCVRFLLERWRKYSLRISVCH